MPREPFAITTTRLRLRSWGETDREAFAALNAHPEVMHDLGGPIERAASDRKLDHYAQAYEEHGYCRWLLEEHDGTFVGYAGVMPCGGDHPLGCHNEIGWRLTRDVWGKGYATEAARAALHDAFTRIGLEEVLAYTGPGNLRSQAVMSRLRLQRQESRDFVMALENVERWHGLVWVCQRTQARSSLGEPMTI